MKLILRLVDANAPAQSRSLDSGTLSIGRGTENDWVLADPDRTLSKNHCRIDASDGGFMLTDLSTNGVFLAGSQQAVGRGHSVVLEDGDSFSMGPYRMLAEIEDGRFGSPDMDATVGPSGNRSPLIPQVEEPWLTGLPSGDFGPGRRAAPHGWDAPPDPAAYAATGLFEPPRGDRPQPYDAVGTSPGLFSQLSEHIPAAATNMRLPETQVVLPTDWMDSDPLEPAESPLPAAAWPPLLPDERPAFEPAPVPPADWLLPVVTIPDAAPVLEPALPEVPIAEAPVPDAEAAVEPAPAVAETVVSSLPLLQAPAPIHEPVVPEAPPVSAPAAALRAVAVPAVQAHSAEAPSAGPVAAFLEGAGLPPDTLAGLDVESAFKEIGLMVRAAVEGVRDIMSTRALVKSEFRVDQTVLRRSDNNQVKFAPDAQRCLAAMVGAAPPGFLPGSAAMQQCMDDIKLHELALIAALNSVFADLDQQLDPEVIMRRARQETSLSTVLPYARDAKCWAIFVETYRLLQESGAANTGGSLLAPLAQAYARQLRR